MLLMLKYSKLKMKEHFQRYCSRPQSVFGDLQKIEFMMNLPEEWTQEEYLREKKRLEAKGVKVLLIDTILNPIEHAQTVTYNPPMLQAEPEGSVFVFYCDTGKATKERLSEFRRKFPGKYCVSLRGGRGYWRKYLNVNDHADA